MTTRALSGTQVLLHSIISLVKFHFIIILSDEFKQFFWFFEVLPAIMVFFIRPKFGNKEAVCVYSKLTEHLVMTENSHKSKEQKYIKRKVSTSSNCHN